MPSITLIETEVATWAEPYQAQYHALVASGTAPALAHMFVSRKAPTMGLQSDRQFNNSYRRQMEQMRPADRDAIVQIAQRAGIQTSGKYYAGELGRYDDPAAWVSTRDDHIGACKAKGLAAGAGATGNSSIVNLKGADAPPPKKVELAPDLVAEARRQYLAHDPKLAEQVKKSKKASSELTERIIHTHGSSARRRARQSVITP